MTTLRCIRCGSLILRPERASVISTAGELAAWGPKCALIAGLVKPRTTKQAQVASKRRPSRRQLAAERAGQIDWILEIEA